MGFRFGRFHIGSVYLPWWLVLPLSPLLAVGYVLYVIPIQLITAIVTAQAAKRRRRT